jgi:hypothetical protein
VYGNQRGRPRGGIRPIRPDAPLEGRRLWEIGSWGNASDHIGQHWELVGQTTLRARLKEDRQLWAGPRPPRPLFLVDKPELQAQFQSFGLTNPDALLLDRDGDATLARPVDFKWSLETASYRQISGDSLAELLAKAGSSLPSSIAEALDLASVGSSATRDGLFYSPDSRPNRQFLASPANRQQEYPLEPKDVVFEAVDGAAFFGALSWWPQARRLAELDRATRSLELLDGAERYYRLGAGVGGAILRLHTSIFATEPPELDVASEVEDTLREYRLRSSLELVEYFRKLMESRNERLRRARELARCPYGFREMLGDLARLGVHVSLEDENSRVERERWGKLHRQIADAHRAVVNAAGLALAEAGSEASALAALERRRPEFELKARALGRQMVRQAVAGG